MNLFSANQLMWAAFIIGNKIYPGAMSEKDIEKAIALERKR